jgi:hypothetical protein
MKLSRHPSIKKIIKRRRKEERRKIERRAE